MTQETLSLPEALDALERAAPDVPLLALGQTIFWDEPMKGGVALASRRLGHNRRFIAGIHDSDYFAKLPSGRRKPGAFKALPHNDTTTRGLWSAAGEFSTLFGSETVITRDALAAAGLRIDRLKEARPEILDEATEAWGWKGIVSLDEYAPITAHVPLRHLFSELKATFDWALESSLDDLTGEGKSIGRKLVEDIQALICDANDPAISVSEYYRRLLPAFYSLCANVEVPLETSTTTELLKFNTETCHLPRFEIVDLFVNQETRAGAGYCYNQALKGGTGQYELSRFGTGAIPFDLVIPGLGRGTIRLGTRGAVIMTREPQFLSYKKPLTGVADLAKLVQEKFGPDCALVGKAVSLIGMFAREHVFVFHEGASSYVKLSRKFHELLEAKFKRGLKMNPILRVRYDSWSALSVTCTWLRLPEPFQRAFGTEEICSPSLGNRWVEVANDQENLLRKLGCLRRPIDLIRFLDDSLGGSWRRLAEEYESLHGKLEALTKELAEIRAQRAELYAEERYLRLQRVELERKKGDHFRAKIFEKNPTPEDQAERKRLTAEVEAVIHRQTEIKANVHALRHRQQEFVTSDAVTKVHERRCSIELEAELKRLRIIRGAYTTAKGLVLSSRRPSAWWFPLVSPDGLWFRETVDQACCYLEPLQ
jgi:hypothetical protein